MFKFFLSETIIGDAFDKYKYPNNQESRIHYVVDVGAVDNVDWLGHSSPRSESGLSLSRYHCDFGQVTLHEHSLHPEVKWVPGIWDEPAMWMNYYILFVITIYSCLLDIQGVWRGKWFLKNGCFYFHYMWSILPEPLLEGHEFHKFGKLVVHRTLG